MKTKKKTVKGMTLVEIIISMFVFAVTALIMVRAGSVINSLTMHSNHVNKKVTIESPLVENGDNIVRVDPTDKKKMASTNSDLVAVTNDAQDLKISMTVKGHSVAVNGKRYNSSSAAAGKNDASTDSDLQYVGVNLELKSGQNVWVDPEPESE